MNMKSVLDSFRRLVLHLKNMFYGCDTGRRGRFGR
jgi:hypothetical protein